MPAAVMSVAPAVHEEGTPKGSLAGAGQHVQPQHDAVLQSARGLRMRQRFAWALVAAQLGLGALGAALSRAAVVKSANRGEDHGGRKQGTKKVREPGQLACRAADKGLIMM